MTIKKFFIPLLLLLAATACGKPVPLHKAAYIGEWQAPEMYLLITPEGRVVYKRYQDGNTVALEGRLQGFRGDDFVIGYGFFTTTFRVTIPPYLSEDATWRMVVDDVELIRTRRLRPPRDGGIMV
jgi:hypothetical protein